MPAQTRESKMNANEIYAEALVQNRLSDYRNFAAQLASGANMATTTTTPATPAGFQQYLNAAVAALPAPLQPYGPVIIVGGGAFLVLMLMSGGNKGRR